MDDRKQFLIHMYNQLFNDINRHIMVIWQSIVVLTGAFAALVLQAKALIPVNISTTMIILIVSWLIAHLYDSSFWYNRNLVIIANIEKQFLKESDIQFIHFYFGKHRPKNKMISHLKIQYIFAIAIALLAIFNHLYTEISNICSCNLFSLLPYVTAVICILWLYNFKKDTDVKYKEFVSLSPGIAINTKDIDYGSGHGGKD